MNQICVQRGGVGWGVCSVSEICYAVLLVMERGVASSSPRSMVSAARHRMFLLELTAASVPFLSLSSMMSGIPPITSTTSLRSPSTSTAMLTEGVSTPSPPGPVWWMGGVATEPVISPPGPADLVVGCTAGVALVVAPVAVSVAVVALDVVAGAEDGRADVVGLVATVVAAVV